MTRLVTRRLHQEAVLWMASGNTDGHGEPTVAAAVEIDVRWEFTRTEMQTPQGDTIVTDATVVVDRDVTLDSILWLGEKDDVPTTFTDNSLHQAVAQSDIPCVRDRSNRRVLGLVRYRNELPTLA